MCVCVCVYECDERHLINALCVYLRISSTLSSNLSQLRSLAGAGLSDYYHHMIIPHHAQQLGGEKEKYCCDRKATLNFVINWGTKLQTLKTIYQRLCFLWM